MPMCDWSSDVCSSDLGAQGCVPCCWRVCLVSLALKLVGPCVVHGFSAGMDTWVELIFSKGFKTKGNLFNKGEKVGIILTSKNSDRVDSEDLSSYNSRIGCSEQRRGDWYFLSLRRVPGTYRVLCLHLSARPQPPCPLSPTTWEETPSPFHSPPMALESCSPHPDQGSAQAAPFLSGPLPEFHLARFAQQPRVH